MFSRPNGPCTDVDIDAVENRLGRRIPASYRELLQRTGGGVLDDDHRVFPDIRSAAPWADGYVLREINGIVGLARDSTAEIFGEQWDPASRVLEIAHLQDNRHGSGAIVLNCGIADAPEGAVLAMTPNDRRWRVLAASFEDFLASLGRRWPRDLAGIEREHARHGTLSPALSGAVDALVASGMREPEVPLRALAERIVEAKGYLGLHEDADSLLFLDMLFALASVDDEPEDPAAFLDRIADLVGDGSDGQTKFRLTYGCSPVFVDDWWPTRNAARGLDYLDRVIDVRYERLMRNLDRAIELYHRFRVTPWEEWLRTARTGIAAGDAHGLTYMLSAYGGMGSISDLHIQGPGHPVTEAEGNPATDRHEEIIAAISEDVRALITLIVPDGTNSPDKKDR